MLYCSVSIASVATKNTGGMAERATPAIPVIRITAVIYGPITARPCVVSLLRGMTPLLR